METKEFVVTVRRRQFDEIAYRMISENEIYGIIDFSVEEQANDVLVSYQNEAYVPLPVYFERELTRAEILRIFENYFAIMDGMAGFPGCPQYLLPAGADIPSACYKSRHPHYKYLLPC